MSDSDSEDPGAYECGDQYDSDSAPVAKGKKSKKPKKKSKKTQAPDIRKYFAIDCESVEGKDKKDILASVAVVNTDLEVIYSTRVCPEEEVLDFRTAITGFESGSLEGGVSFSVARDKVIAVLNAGAVVGHSVAVVVGHSVAKDLKWLDLHEGDHYKSSIDTATKFQKEYPNRKHPIRFKLDLILKTRFPETERPTVHSAERDAIGTMRLFNETKSMKPKEINNFIDKLLVERKKTRAV